MNELLLSDSKQYLAENCIRSFTTPAFVPSVVYSAIGGVLTFALFEKYVRKSYFLPYIYFAITALSYTLEHIFLIIFVEEEHQIDKDNTDGQDITHENALYASLTIASIGLFFALLAIFRLLETWIRAGLKRNLHLSKYYLTILAVLLCAIPLAFSIAGDIVLILESSIYEEMAGQVRKALVLKLIGASCNVTLALFFLILLISYSLSAYTRISGSKRYAESQEKLPAVAGKSDEQKLRTVALLLLTMGTLVLVRVLYDLYIVGMVTKSGPLWDINANLVLVVSDGIILLLVAYILDLSMVKEATVATKKFNEETLAQDAIPFSRSPVYIEHEE